MMGVKIIESLAMFDEIFDWSKGRAERRLP